MSVRRDGQSYNIGARNQVKWPPTKILAHYSRKLLLPVRRLQLHKQRGWLDRGDESGNEKLERPGSFLELYELL